MELSIFNFPANLLSLLPSLQVTSTTLSSGRTLPEPRTVEVNSTMVSSQEQHQNPIYSRRYPLLNPSLPFSPLSPLLLTTLHFLAFQDLSSKPSRRTLDPSTSSRRTSTSKPLLFKVLVGDGQDTVQSLKSLKVSSVNYSIESLYCIAIAILRL